MGYARLHVNKPPPLQKTGSRSALEESKDKSMHYINAAFNSSKFVYSKIGGIICFCVDRRRQVPSLRIFDVNNFRMIF